MFLLISITCRVGTSTGAIELFFNKTWGDLDDMSDLLGYITSIGVTMGNKGQYHLKGDKNLLQIMNEDRLNKLIEDASQFDLEITC